MNYKSSKFTAVSVTDVHRPQTHRHRALGEDCWFIDEVTSWEEAKERKKKSRRS